MLSSQLEFFEDSRAFGADLVGDFNFVLKFESFPSLSKNISVRQLLTQK